MLRCTLLLACASVLASQQISPPRKWRAQVTLHVDLPQEVQPAAISYFSRELRALSDIEIVDQDPDFIIEVVGVQNQVSGTTVGYTLSTVLLRVMRSDIVDIVAGADQTPAIYKQGLRNYMEGAGHMLWHNVRATSIGNFPTTCRTIIADIDGHAFEEDRKTWRQYVQK